MSFSAARVIAVRSARASFRDASGTRVLGARFNSSSSSAQLRSQLVSGLIGGGVVLAGGYAWYHFSGAKSTVDTSTQVITALTASKEKAIAAAPKPNDALAYLRATAKAYTVFIPGAAAAVDATFDALDELHDDHREEVDGIIYRTYEDIRKITNNKSVDLESAVAVITAIQQRAAELGAVASKVQSGAIPKIVDSHESKNTYISQLVKYVLQRSEELKNAEKSPQKEVGLWDLVGMIPGGQKAIESTPGLRELLKLTESKGSEAEKLTQETYNDVFKVLRDKAEKAIKLRDDTKQSNNSGK
ncbi:hypothetical protein BDV93DRAFT_602626 [Ceratobasidium sp. AG-I]|nr:hypothetical protein BDV93DRAFT_602626 [Ceratobasidium sp. AG-I]